MPSAQTGRLLSATRPMIAPAGLIINHPEISRQHARIRYQQGNYILEDLGSRNGTFINGQPVHGPQVLVNNAEIQLGTETRLVFNQSQAQAVPVGGTMMESDLTAGVIQASISGPINLLVTIA